MVFAVIRLELQGVWLVSQCGCSDAVLVLGCWDDDEWHIINRIRVPCWHLCEKGSEMSDRLMRCMARLCASRRQLRCHLVCLLISFGCGMPAAGTACHSTFDSA